MVYIGDKINNLNNIHFDKKHELKKNDSDWKSAEIIRLNGKITQLGNAKGLDTNLDLYIDDKIRDLENQKITIDI